MESTQDQRESRTSRWRARDLIWVIAFVGIIVVGRVTPIEPVRDFFGSFDWLTRQSVRLANHLFESYGYPTVFFAPLLENTLFLGALIPGTLIMLLAGLSAHDGLIAFWPAILLGIAGAIIGDTISYGMGRFGWQKLGPDSRIVRWAEKMREPLLERSIWLVFTYHFAGYSRLVGPAASGFLRMPFLRWMLLDYTGVALWVTTFITGGYLLGMFGLSLDDSDQNIRVFEIILFAFFTIAVISVMRAASRSNRQQADEPTAGTAPTPDGAPPTITAARDAARPTSQEEKPEQVR